jgi:polyphosphate kinase
MPRNLDRRVEALVPVTSEPLRERLAEILSIDLTDDTLSWELDADGAWHRVAGGRGVNTQRRLQDLAVQRARAVESRA